METSNTTYNSSPTRGAYKLSMPHSSSSPRSPPSQVHQASRTSPETFSWNGSPSSITTSPPPQQANHLLFHHTTSLTPRILIRHLQDFTHSPPTTKPPHTYHLPRCPRVHLENLDTSTLCDNRITPMSLHPPFQIMHPAPPGNAEDNHSHSHEQPLQDLVDPPATVSGLVPTSAQSPAATPAVIAPPGNRSAAEQPIPSQHTIDGVVYGAGSSIATSENLTIDQGLDTGEISVAMLAVGDPLRETQYLIEMDNRLGQVTGMNPNTIARPSFVRGP